MFAVDSWGVDWKVKLSQLRNDFRGVHHKPCSRVRKLQRKIIGKSSMPPPTGPMLTY